MWIAFAVGSACFAGLTSILAKLGMQKVNSNLATALRTGFVLVFAWLMTALSGTVSQLEQISGRSFVFLGLSGLATGASWLCYFRALQLGDVNRVVPIDKTSTIVTMLLAFLLLGEGITWVMGLGMVLIGGGTYLMIVKKDETAPVKAGKGWFLYAALSALFAALTAILAKLGMQDVPSDLATALRTVVVLAMAWVVVFATRSQKGLGAVDKKSWLLIGLSGVATGLSWLCYYRALQEGPASIVVPIDKLSILVTAALAWLFFKERLGARALAGLAILTAGTLVLLIRV